MVVGRKELLLSDGTEYLFTIAPDSDQHGKGINIAQKNWEPGDPVTPWRKALHPFDAGLTLDKMVNPRGYGKANADCSVDGIVVPPPKINTITVSGTIDDTINVRANIPSSTVPSDTTITLTKPTGTVDGNLLIAMIGVHSAVAITAPAGWSALTARDGTDSRYNMYYKIAASEGASWDWTVGAADQLVGAVICLTGNHATPIDDSDSTTGFSTPAATSSVTNVMVVAGFGVEHPATWTPPTGMVERIETSTTDIGIEIATSYQQVAGAVSAKTATPSGGLSTEAGSFVLVVKPASVTVSITADYEHGVYFNNKVYLSSGQYLVSVNTSYAATVEKAFGSSASITDLKVFNNELIIALGGSARIWKLDTSGNFTEATDATFASVIGQIGRLLYRVEPNNKVSNCITTPLTLSSWVPADPNQHIAGDSTYAANGIFEYNGNIYITKPDGVFAPDFKAEFFNQCPQIQWPNSSNGVGSFIAFNALWVPTAGGMVRISDGESIFIGPEITYRKDMRFATRHGVEFGDASYLLCDDLAGVSQSFVCKMMRSQDGYVFHEWARLGSTTAADVIVLFPATTNPSLVIGHGTALKYIKLGRGGGRHIDDANYEYGTAWELETGDFIPSDNLSLLSSLIGVKIVLDHDASEEVTLSYDVDGSGSFTNLLNTQEGGGSAAINTTSGYAAVTRYAAANIQGQFFNIKLTGTMSDAHLGTDRPEVREVWAFGFSHPENTDLITLNILADTGARVRGIRQGRTPGQIFRLFRDWKNRGVTLTGELHDYEESRTTRFQVVDTHMSTIETVKTRDRTKETNYVQVTLQRVDFAQAYADS